jgi:hypothetical protein
MIGKLLIFEQRNPVLEKLLDDIVIQPIVNTLD